MSRIFISHSSADDHLALALREWLAEEGWPADNDVYLDIHPDSGMAAGQRWLNALEEAATRCEVVVFLVSEAWLYSKCCNDEMRLAQSLNKKIFTLLVEDIELTRLPHSLVAEWQVVALHVTPFTQGTKCFRTNHPISSKPGTSYFSADGLQRLRNGLVKAGIGADSFELQPDPHGPFGWRMPYRGLEPLQFEDAAVFFGRDADIVRATDTLRGLTVRNPPRMLVVLGASGAGKSSFLRAGLLPRLQRDDIAWIPFPPIRVADHGAIDGAEGLLAGLVTVHERFHKKVNRAELRDSITSTEKFIDLLRNLRHKAAQRALLTEKTRPPMPLISIDQAEELANADANPEALQMLRLFRAALDSGDMILVTTIRSDSYDSLQNTEILAGVSQTPFSLAPIALGEIALIIRGPAEALKIKAGRDAPSFSAEVVDELQREMAAELDAMPLLAFALQRLVLEHAATATIGVEQLAITGGITRAIGSAVTTALSDAGVDTDPAVRRKLLRAVFIPRLARIDVVSHLPQRRVADWKRFNDPQLMPILRALVEKRILVSKGGDKPTLEVAHEALLQRWSELSDLLFEDRESLLHLDRLQRAAAAWRNAGALEKKEFLVHRRQQLTVAATLLKRNDYAAELKGEGVQYIQACEATERQEVARAAKQARTRKKLQLTVVSLTVIAAVATILGWLSVREGKRSLASKVSDSLAVETDVEYRAKQYDRAMRVALAAYDKEFYIFSPFRNWTLARSAYASRLRADLRGYAHWVTYARFSQDGRRVVTVSMVDTARVWLTDAEGQWSSQELQGHAGRVFNATFSPDNKHVVTASIDRTARVWSADADGHWSSKELKGHTGFVYNATFSPDGKRVVTTSSDETARVWSSDTDGRWSSQVLKGHTGAVFNATFSPDSKHVVTASIDKTARVWSADADDRWSSQELKGHTREVGNATFSPDGKRVVTASRDNTARVWSIDAEGYWSSAKLIGHTDIVSNATFSPDNKRVVTASDDNTARVWSIDANGDWASQELKGHADQISNATFSPDSKRVVTASRDNTARVWTVNTEGHWASLELEGHADRVNSAIFSQDGKRVLTASNDRTVRIWSVDTQIDWPSQGLKGHTSRINNATFSPDGERVVTASWDKTARVWSTDAEGHWASQELKGHTHPVNTATFSPDGKRVATASNDNTARIWSSDAEGHWASQELKGHRHRVNTATFSPNGKLVVTASHDKTARIWSTNIEGRWTSQELKGHGDIVKNATFSPNGKHLVTASRDNTARVWSVDEEGRWGSQELKGHGDIVTNATFSQNGKHVVTASWDNTARVWSVDAEGHWVSQELKGHGDLVTNATFSPDSKRVATASFDNTARVWSADTEGQWSSQELRGHANAVENATFSQDGKYLVTVSSGNAARIWWSDAEGHWSSQELKGHTGHPNNAMFSPDSKRVVTTTSDEESARVWDVQWLTTLPYHEDFPVRVCEEKLPPALRIITHADTLAVSSLRGREGENVCDPFLK